MSANERDSGEPAKEVTIPEALKLAIYAHRSGERGTARTILERVLAIVPDHPDAMHFLGVVKWAEGEQDEAIELVERSVASQPQMTDWRNNLANMYLRLDRIAEARGLYEGVITEDPKHVSAWINLGLVERLSDAPAKAEVAFQNAIASDPQHAEAHLAMAKLLYSERRVEESTMHLYKSIASAPANAGGSRALLSRAYFSLGDKEKAIQVLRDWCEAEPNNHAARHYLGAVDGIAPSRASAAYIEGVFDDYATSFDSSLARLGYRAPELIAAALRRSLGAPDGRLIGLDAGCGTGLVGPLVAPYFARLDGVDLSRKMMLKAKARNAYSALRHAELTADMEAHADRYDIIISADTLIYFGALEAVMAAAFKALRPSGLLLFSLEREQTNEPSDGYRLQIHGRYCHREPYVRGCLAGAGLAVVDIVQDVLRHEAGTPVAGFIVTARKP